MACLIGAGLGLVGFVFYAWVGSRTASGLEDVRRVEELRLRLAKLDVAIDAIGLLEPDAALIEATRADALEIARSLRQFDEPSARVGAQHLVEIAATAGELAGMSRDGVVPDLAAIDDQLVIHRSGVSTALDRLLEARHGEIHTLLIRAVVTLVVAASLVAALCLLAFGVIYHRVGRPVRDIQRGLEAVAAGDFATRLPVPRDDELGRLAASFNHTVEQLETAEAKRREALADLGRTKQQLERAQQVARLGSWEVDLVAGELAWSDEVFRVFAVDPEVFGGTEEAFFELVAPDDREELRGARERFLAGEGDLDARHRIVRPDGEIRWVHERAQLLRDATGEPRRMVGTVQDVTEEQVAEQEAAEMRQRLAQASRLEAIGRLAGGVAHDFNNMLTVIGGHAELLLDRLDADDEAVAFAVGQIRDAALRSAELTGQLLAFSRQQPAALEVVDLNVVVGELVPLLRRLLGEEIALEVTIADDLWPVRIDRSQVGQILSNLCVNSKDAIDGHGSIVVETANVTVEEDEALGPGLLPAGRYARLTVSDDGCGMEREVLDQIFEPFFTTKAAGEGTGLGLATVYGIVRQADGFINAYSEPGEGTRFSIYLPRLEGDAAGVAASEAVPAEPPPVGGGETVLVVEDERVILELCEQILDGLGYRVIARSSSTEALKTARESERIEVLLTDVVMPDMNGRELAERILEIHPETKVLLMSGYTADVVARRGVLTGEWSLLEKPFTPSSLAASVRRVLDG